MAFFGEAMRRTMRETDTENLFFGDVVCRGRRRLRGASGTCVGAEARGLVGAVRRCPEKQAWSASAMTPFTSCGRIWGGRGVCELALNVQVRGRYGMGMVSD